MKQKLPRAPEDRGTRTVSGRPQSSDLLAGLQRLTAGERGVRLNVRATGTDHEAETFNALAQKLDRVLPPAHDAANSLLEAELLAADQHNVFVAIVAIDGFVRLRHHIGSALSNRILQEIAQRVMRSLPDARLCRFGRTNLEFAFPAATFDQAEAQLERLRTTLEARLQIDDGKSFDLHVAIGFASHRQCGDLVIESAAEALAQAQAMPLKRVRAYQEEDRQRAAASEVLLRDLHQAIHSNTLALAYQPKLHTRTNSIDSVEALLRWTHPEHGPIRPDSFIALTEETGLIADLTRWVVLRAISDQARLAEAGYPLTVYINLSGRLVPDKAFTQWLINTVAEQAVGPVGFEITETAGIGEPELALANLQAMADAGIKLSIDDYGAGLSSLAYIKQLPAGELKIDRLFIQGLTSSHRDPLLVRSTIELAHALGMMVTAEGVESPMALALLRTMGCDQIQGYLISLALFPDDLLTFLEESHYLERTSMAGNLISLPKLRK